MIGLTPEQKAVWEAAAAEVASPPSVSPRWVARAMDDPPEDGLRDRFATAALTGLLSVGWADPAITAAAAYEYADAMLKARRE